MKAEVYCLQNIPKCHGDLWISLLKGIVTIMNPAPPYWRGRVLPKEEFEAEVKDLRKRKR